MNPTTIVCEIAASTSRPTALPRLLVEFEELPRMRTLLDQILKPTCVSYHLLTNVMKPDNSRI